MFENLNTEELLSTLELALPYATNVLVALFILFLGWMISKSVHRNISKFAARKLDPMVAGFLAQLARYSVLAATVIAALERCGVETTSVVAIFASAGLAVGLALQGSLSNFSAGVMLLLFRPFSVGDVVTAGGVTGGVQQIGLFNTVLKTPDAVVITVPNGQVFGSVISNMTSEDMRRVDVGIGVAYDADPRSAKKLLIEAVDGVFGVLSEQGTDAYLIELGASSVDFQIRAWCKPADYWAVREQILNQGKLALDDAGIGIPYQTLDLNIVSSPLPGNVSQLITGSNMRPASERSA